MRSLQALFGSEPTYNPECDPDWENENPLEATPIARFKEDDKRMVRAKFYVQRIEKSKYGYAPDQKEMTTIVLAPVYSAEPGTENKKFWDATPTGEIKLGTINLEAANQFELGVEYFIDFTKASGAD